MQTFDSFTYFNGLSVAFFFITCLICGLELCFDIFRIRKSDDVILSRMLGIIFLLMTCEAACSIVLATVASAGSLFQIRDIINILIFTGVAGLAYVLYSNNQPSPRVLVFLSLPFVAIVVLFMIVPSWRGVLSILAMVILIADYLYYGLASRSRECSLEDIYSDTEPHSLKWIMGVVWFFIGWLVFHVLFYYFGPDGWYDCVMYIYMTCFVLFTYGKVLNYGAPVSLATLEQIENSKQSEVNTSPANSNTLQAAFEVLLEGKEIYLNPNLTVENVATMLNTTPLYFSSMLHNDMHTTFSALINQYRVEKAKVLLTTTDLKIEYISQVCGYNSQPVFNRTFIRFTGKTPSQWRNDMQTS